MLNGLAVFNRVGLAHFYNKSCLNEFKLNIVSNLAIMMTMLCISLSASYASMLNGLAQFNRVGWAQF